MALEDEEQNLGERVDNFNDYTNKKLRDQLSNEITQKGVKGECKLSRKTIELFIEILVNLVHPLNMLLKEITEEVGLSHEGRGICFSIPVDNVVGLTENIKFEKIIK